MTGPRRVNLPPWRRKRPRALCSGTGGPPRPGQPLTCPICERVWDTEGTVVPRHFIYAKGTGS